jgi:hypothetical protein
MPYLNTVNSAPASLKSQETNFIQNHVNQCMTAETSIRLTTGSTKKKYDYDFT